MTVFGCLVPYTDSWMRYAVLTIPKDRPHGLCVIYNEKEYHCALWRTCCCDGRVHRLCERRLKDG